MNEKQSWNITALFLLLVFGLSLASVLKPKKTFSETENRTLSQMPALTTGDILSGKFEEDYESYLSDQFVMRDKWISVRTAAERAMLKQEVHDVYFSKDQYLIEKHTGVFTSKQADLNVDFLKAFASEYIPRFGEDHMSFMFIPNAVMILSDLLPWKAFPYDEGIYLNRLRNCVPEGTWFDASSILSDHADEGIYYKTDHHWTTRGAFFVFQGWAWDYLEQNVSPSDYTVRTVTDSFEGTVASKIGIRTTQDTIEAYDSVTRNPCTLTYNQTDDIRSTVYQEHVLDSKDKYAYFFGGNYALIQVKTSLSTGRRLLVIKDSYAHCFAPFLFDCFDEVDLLDLRYYNSSLADFIEDGSYTDLLFLQNAANFAEDMSMSKLLT